MAVLQNHSPAPATGVAMSSRAAMIYALPVLGSIALAAPMASIIQGIYNKYVGLQLALIGALLLAVRVTDAIAGPYIGHLSDRYRLRTGTRKPLIAVSSVGLVLCGFFLFDPLPGAGGWYFLIWALGFIVCGGVLEINRSAWAIELTDDPHARTRIFTYNGLFAQIGYLISLGFPLLPIFATSEFTPRALKVMALLFGSWLLTTVFMALRHVPNGRFITSAKKVNFFWFLKKNVSNKPFLIYIGFSCFFGIALGATAGIEFVIWDGYFGIGDKVAAVYIVVLSVGIASVPMVNRLVKKFGKLPVFSACAISYITFPLAFLYVSPGENAFIAIAIIQGVNGIAFSCYTVLQPSLFADIVDYSTWKNRYTQTATYTSINNLFGKTCTALGTFLGLFIAGFLGFDPALGIDPDEARKAIHITYCWVPALLQLLAVILVFKMPLNTKRMRIIQRRLETRAQREKAKIATNNKAACKIDRFVENATKPI